MLAILGGFGAALAWAASTLCSSRASRIIDPASVVSWVAVVGLVVTLPLLAAAGVPSDLHGGVLGWLLIAGAGNLVGLLLAYLAYRSGSVTLVAPLIATEGAIAAVIAFAAGEQITAGAAAALAVTAVGVSIAAVPGRTTATAVAEPGALAEPVALAEPGPPEKPGRLAAPAPGGRVLALSGLAAICFGLSLYATGRVSSRLAVAWVVLPARLLGTLLLAAPLALGGRLALRRPVVPLVAAAGVCEVLGVSSFTFGARHDIAVAAVVACQFAAISAIVAFVAFGERIGRLQLAGVIVLLLGVSALSAIRG